MGEQGDNQPESNATSELLFAESPLLPPRAPSPVTEDSREVAVGEATSADRSVRRRLTYSDSFDERVHDLRGLAESWCGSGVDGPHPNDVHGPHPNAVPTTRWSVALNAINQGRNAHVTDLTISEDARAGDAQDARALVPMIPHDPNALAVVPHDPNALAPAVVPVPPLLPCGGGRGRGGGGFGRGGGGVRQHVRPRVTTIRRNSQSDSTVRRQGASRMTVETLKVVRKIRRWQPQPGQPMPRTQVQISVKRTESHTVVANRFNNFNGLDQIDGL